MGLKSRLKPFVPPVIVDLARRIGGRPGVSFEGNYASWDDASRHAAGYDSEAIANRVVAATRSVVNGAAVYERDSVLFDHIDYSWPLLASLLQVALERNSLRVVDFGGALGSTWRQNQRFLSRLNIPLAWHVVEQPHFVAAGKKEFSTDTLTFDATIAEAAGTAADAVLFLGSLCYVPDPARFLREAAATTAPFLIIDRLPIVAGESDRIAVQTTTEPIYNASYPIRMFAERKLFADWLRPWRLIERWDCDLQPDPQSRSYGLLLEKR